MPYFINNHGKTVVPSLEYLAMVNEGITEEGMLRVPPVFQEMMKKVYQRLGGVDYRFGGPDTVYIEGDVTAERVPCHRMKLDPFHSIYDSRNMPPEQKICEAAKITDWSIATTKWEELKNILMINLPEIKAIICRNSGIDDKENFIHLHSGRGGKMTMEVTVPSFLTLAAYGFNLSSVDELRIVDFTPISDVDLQCFLRKLPNLRSFNITPIFVPQMGVLAQQRNTLRDLQITCRMLCTNLAGVLKDIPHLELLSLVWTRNNGHGVELNALELSSTLRSLSLFWMPEQETSTIISFLTRKVNHGGVMVARELLLEDLTIFGAEEEEMALLYNSTALTQRMKARIYCDIDVDHLTATIKIAATRNNFGLFLTNSSLLHRVQNIMPDHCHRYRPILMSVTLELFRNSPKDRPYNPIYYVLHRLLPTYEIAMQFDRHVLHSVLKVIVNGHNQLASFALYNGYCQQATNMLIILDKCNVAPSAISRYLECVLNLIVPPSNREMLATLFMKQAKKLTAKELEEFFDTYKTTFTRACFRFIYKHCHQFKRSVTLSNEMIDMFSLALNSADNDLKIAANAVLRRCKGGPAASSWCKDTTEVEEENLREKLNCQTLDDARLK